ncbi:hypothetical protein ACFLU6_04540 [Acidobacteriota bacterium]
MTFRRHGSILMILAAFAVVGFLAAPVADACSTCPAHTAKKSADSSKAPSGCSLHKTSDKAGSKKAPGCLPGCEAAKLGTCSHAKATTGKASDKAPSGCSLHKTSAKADSKKAPGCLPGCEAAKLGTCSHAKATASKTSNKASAGCSASKATKTSTGCEPGCTKACCANKASLTHKGGCCTKSAFSNLKALAGQWKAKVDGNDKETTSINYAVTANGSAVIETLFPGTPHEMITVYHMNGGELMLTHYCAEGNQPRMKLDGAKSTPDNLIFVFDGGTNLNADKDTYMHATRIKFVGKDKVNSEWDYYEGGKQKGTYSFSLVRDTEL